MKIRGNKNQVPFWFVLKLISFVLRGEWNCGQRQRFGAEPDEKISLANLVIHKEEPKTIVAKRRDAVICFPLQTFRSGYRVSPNVSRKPGDVVGVPLHDSLFHASVLMSIFFLIY
jgi:hypothetical protein